MKVKQLNPQAGFSLVELMVAMVLFLLLILNASSLLISNIQSFKTASGLSRVQEGARFSIDELAKNMRMAGFIGCDAGAQPANLLNLTDAVYDFSNGVAGEDNVAVSTLAANALAGTDVLQIKRYVDMSAYLVAPVLSSAVSMSLNSTDGFSAGDIVFIGDCEKSTLLKIDSVSGSNLNFTNSGMLSANGEGFNSDSAIYKVELRTYYVAESIFKNSSGAFANSLWVNVNDEAPQELVVGVKNLQVLYGVDTDSNGVPDTYQDAGAAAMTDVSVVRLLLNTTSFDNVLASGLLNRDFSISIALRNRLVEGA